MTRCQYTWYACLLPEVSFCRLLTAFCRDAGTSSSEKPVSALSVEEPETVSPSAPSAISSTLERSPPSAIFRAATRSWSCVGFGRSVLTWLCISRSKSLSAASCARVCTASRLSQ